jgi:biopolymer transport protein ExbB
VYAQGCKSYRKQKNNSSADNPDGIMKAFKAALEQGYVQENKRLNSRILVLTLAITGGPFLGLLGTVWGVMNTFAALAEAGEANIMAIAPGVASALSTTVFGLIVAIPALFAYNFLAANIKNITADMAVFIDQFTLKVDGSGGEAK